MTYPQFDMFRKEGDEVLWFGTAKTLEDARRKICAEAQSIPDGSEYLVLNQVTGERFTFAKEKAA